MALRHVRVRGMHLTWKITRARHESRERATIYVDKTALKFSAGRKELFNLLRNFVFTVTGIRDSIIPLNDAISFVLYLSRSSGSTESWLKTRRKIHIYEQFHSTLKKSTARETNISFHTRITTLYLILCISYVVNIL